MQRDGVGDDLFPDSSDGLLDLVGSHEFRALVVHDLALVVRNVVVLEQVLADIEVVGFHLALRTFDLARQQLTLDRLALTHAGPRQQALGALRVAEDAHQRVFHGQVEAAGTRVALAPRAPAQLVVDTA